MGIKIGLVDRHKPFEDDRGVVRIDGRAIEIVDLNSGAPVVNVKTWLWGPGDILIEPGKDALFTPEHLDGSKDYLVLVIPCDAAKRLD